MTSRSPWLAWLGAATCAAALTASALAAEPPDWSRFRGPNGSGISTATNVPTEFGPAKNLLWRLAMPPGHSSPILLKDRIYLTAFRGGFRLWTVEDVPTISADPTVTRAPVEPPDWRYL